MIAGHTIISEWIIQIDVEMFGVLRCALRHKQELVLFHML